MEKALFIGMCAVCVALPIAMVVRALRRNRPQPLDGFSSGISTDLAHPTGNLRGAREP